MTYDGNFTNNQTIVSVPFVESLASSSAPIVSSTSGLAEFTYQAGDFVYLVQSTNNSVPRGIYKASLKNPTVMFSSNNTFINSSYGYFASYVSIGNDLYAFGGTGGPSGNAGTAIYKSSLLTPEQWSLQTSTLNLAKQRASIAVVGSNIYIYGGQVTAGFSAVNTIITATTADPLTWTTSGNTLPATLSLSSCAVVGTNVYLFGGSTNSQSSGAVSTIYRATTAAPTVFTAVGNLPVALAEANLYDDGTYLYLIGGYDTSSIEKTTVYRASHADPLTWMLQGNALPEGKARGTVTKVNNTVYLYGGTSFGGTSKIVSGANGTPGTVGPWSDRANELAAARTRAAYYTDDGYVWMFGGESSYLTPTNTIQRALKSSPFEWSTVGTLPTSITGATVVRIDNFLYMLSGYSGSAIPKTYRAAVSDPTTWVLHNTNSCPYSLSGICIAGQYVYAIGGVDGYTSLSSVQDSVFRSPIGNELKGNDWVQVGATTTNLVLPNVAVVGSYMYTFGGLTTISNTSTQSTNLIKRSNVNDPSIWTSLSATLAVATAGASVALMNGNLYLLGGNNNAAAGTTTTQACSLNDLVAGKVNFTTITTAINTGLMGAATSYIGDILYLFGNSTSTSTISKASYFTTFNTPCVLSMPKTESLNSIPAIDLATGANTAYTSFQLSGNLPWITNKKTR